MTSMLMHAGAVGHLHAGDFAFWACWGLIGLLAIVAQRSTP